MKHEWSEQKYAIYEARQCSAVSEWIRLLLILRQWEWRVFCHDVEKECPYSGWFICFWLQLPPGSAKNLWLIYLSDRLIKSKYTSRQAKWRVLFIVKRLRQWLQVQRNLSWKSNSLCRWRVLRLVLNLWFRRQLIYLNFKDFINVEKEHFESSRGNLQLTTCLCCSELLRMLFRLLNLQNLRIRILQILKLFMWINKAEHCWSCYNNHK